LDHAAGFVDQGSGNADSGSLARPIGSEQREKIPFFDLEIDCLEGLNAVFVYLGELSED
jgi:hypothetical protein